MARRQRAGKDRSGKRSPAVQLDPAKAEMILGAALSRVAVLARAVGNQADRLTPTWEQPVRQRDIMPDAILMAFALRGLLRAAELVGQLSGTPSAVRATALFMRSVPNVTQARDVLEHFDDYVTGRGRHKQALGFNPRVKSDGKLIFLEVDPWSIEVHRAARAAGKLAERLWLDPEVQRAAGVLHPYNRREGRSRSSA